MVVDHWSRKDIERAYLDAISHLPPVRAPSEEDRLILIESLMRIDAILGQAPHPAWRRRAPSGEPILQDAETLGRSGSLGLVASLTSDGKRKTNCGGR
ncbi:hypothetical protein FAZ78_08135 [Cereibacter changlensis]|uniref:Uncharacterized protein n=1 Tax=Cereibacter changlensis TaxID=402884 RepID=A0A4U0YYV6_9RHOB|nr:hypothetical protein [Cereibacter changlensis]TKA97075.1 hypothetical protein FAZ78_08135 [Cereibacter changlensis]